MRLAIALCVTLAATPAFADPDAFIEVTDPPLVTATVFGNQPATLGASVHHAPRLAKWLLGAGGVALLIALIALRR